MTAPVRRQLEERAHEFEFFQLVRLLQKGLPDREPVGRAGDPANEAARFGVHPTLSFPPCEVRELRWNEAGPPAMAVHFFGLTGPVGVLPTHYTAYILERLYARDATLRDFVDLFHHRLLSLFYRAWEKYRFAVPYERGEKDSFTRHLLDLVGLGTPGLQNRQAVYDQSLLFYAGLLAQQPRSSGALRQILADYFDVDVEVEPFAGTWRALDPDSWSFLNEGSRQSEQLGVGVILGDEVWDPQSVVLIRIGPLTMRQYRDFLPDGTAYAPLRSITRFFCGDDFDVEVQLVLRSEDAPRCALDAPEEPQPQLGWTSWLFTRPPERDPDDTILRLWEAGTSTGPVQ
ncbi:MAG: type VI secretion system baseplate subunit TssG [Bryobacteraceae bacterium]|nr:type VI secretion system baseplate subunit TssG [Bryobacteraceae bacterium]